MAEELTYSDIVEEVATPETAPAAANVKVYLNDGNDFLQMGLEDFEEAYNITDLRDRLKKGTGEGAVVEGKLSNMASGTASHAEGGATHAFGAYAHAEGNNTEASGSSAHAEGGISKASGAASHAEGANTKAVGNSAHSEGRNTEANGDYSHAEGYDTRAYEKYSHTEGYSTAARSECQHVSGKWNVVDRDNKYAEIIGNGTADNARSNARTLDWQGNEKLAGKLTVGAGPTEEKDVTTKEYVDGLTKAEKLGFAFATCPTAEATVAKVATCSNYTIAKNGFVAVKFDYAVPANATLNINSRGAHEIYHKGIAITAGVIEADDIALFVYDGNKYQLLGINRDFWDLSDRIARGTGTKAVVEGNTASNKASGNFSHAEGSMTVASGGYATHAEGGNTRATGATSHSEGSSTTASGSSSHAEGYGTVASGESSHAEGMYTVAAGKYQHAGGTYNIEDSNNTYAEIIGNGTANNARSNIRTLDWNGNEVIAGKMTVGAGPTADMDVATKKYIDDLLKKITHGSYCGVCDTAAATADKVVMLHGDYYLLHKGGIVVIRFTYDVPANATLNIDNQGAKMIIKGTGPLQGGEIVAGDTVSMMYDGSYYIIMSITH
ncbi:MAG TPA: hypothetical protein DHV42_03210 [Lachnospiraceae bacterium]|nr:hypothetical protein [Lachnospiraceae bacterium]